MHSPSNTHGSPATGAKRNTQPSRCDIVADSMSIDQRERLAGGGEVMDEVFIFMTISISSVTDILRILLILG